VTGKRGPKRPPGTFAIAHRYGLSPGEEFDATPRAMLRLIKALDLSAGEALVLMAVLARYRPENGPSYHVSISELDEFLPLTRSGVHWALKKLSDRGVLTIQSSQGTKTTIVPASFLARLRVFVARGVTLMPNQTTDLGFRKGTPTVHPTGQSDPAQLSTPLDSTVQYAGLNCPVAEPGGDDPEPEKDSRENDAHRRPGESDIEFTRRRQAEVLAIIAANDARRAAEPPPDAAERAAEG
jgi:hypothetical protein